MTRPCRPVHIEFLRSRSSARRGWDDFWSQADPGMVDGPELGDRFGYALTAGDLNDDHYADLAVGIPEEDIGTTYNAGAVHILYGRSGGIGVTGNQFWHQDSNWIEDDSQEHDNFGCSLAAIPSPPPSHKIHLPLLMRNN